MQIEFPTSDFGVPFEKDYEVSGAQFTIRVLYMGVDTLGPVWLFQLIVKGNQIEGGPYHPGQDRELTDENVANHLASFWGHTQMVQDAWQLAGSSEWELDQIVEMCAAFMFRYYTMEGVPFDYDILAKRMDEESWTVALLPNVRNASSTKDPYEHMILFYKHKDRANIQISTYNHERSFQRRNI